MHQNVDHPLSLYAASKKANEAMAHTYAHLYGLPTTGLRFFTVYGPWGRPDMAMLLRLIELLEETLGREAIKNYLPMQAGDVQATVADVADLTRDTGFTPATPIEVGVPRFVAWYRSYHGV